AGPSFKALAEIANRRICANCAAAGPYCKILPMLLVRPWGSISARLAALSFLFGTLLIAPASPPVVAQAPKDAAAKTHSPRQDRLAALGLLAVPLEDEKVI